MDGFGTPVNSNTTDDTFNLSGQQFRVEGITKRDIDPLNTLERLGLKVVGVLSLLLSTTKVTTNTLDFILRILRIFVLLGPESGISRSALIGDNKNSSRSTGPSTVVGKTLNKKRYECVSFCWIFFRSVFLSSSVPRHPTV